MSQKPWYKAILSNSIARIVGVFLLIGICILIVLAMLGPVIGSQFDNILMSFDGSGDGGANIGSTSVSIDPTPTQEAVRATNQVRATADVVVTEMPMTTFATMQLDTVEIPTDEELPLGDDPDTGEAFPIRPSPTQAPLTAAETTRTSASGDMAESATVVSTESADQVEDVSTPQPTLVAVSNVTIVDVSGDVIGDGTLKVYNTTRVDFPNSARVELELNFDNKYITPTPFGQVTSVAVTQVTSTPRPGQPTPTEREPAYAVSGVQFNQLMGASLICLETQFDGCDDEPDPDDVQLITLAGRTWSWTIRPREEVSGYQDLSIELWKVQQVNGRDVTETIWNYGFTVLVNEAPASIPVLWLIIGGGALGVGSIFIYAGWLSWRKRVQASKPRPKAFVSYRRSTSWAAARTIHDRLTEYGAEIFIDVEDINDGRFASVITDAIERCDFFILVLSPGSLESEWVIKEAQHALKHNKRIIPVLVDGFDLYSGDLPVELKDITAHNAIKLTPEFFNAGIDRIARFMNLLIP